MEGIDPHEPSIHAKLIEKMDEGYLQPFTLKTINIGLGNLDTYALSAQIRMWCEEFCETELQRNALWAIYGDTEAIRGETPLKLTAIDYVARYLSNSFRMKKTRATDLLGYCLSTEKKREEIPIEYIASRHGVSVYRTETEMIKIDKRLGSIKKSFLVNIRKDFRRRGLIG